MEKRTPPSQHSTIFGATKRAFVLLFAVFLALSVLSPTAHAAWDGDGEAPSKINFTA